MYVEQLNEEQLEAFYNQNQIVCQNKDGSEFPFKYRIHADGKFYNFDKEKFGYTMFLKDFTINVSWLHGPVKQQLIKNWQNFQKGIFLDYEDALNEHIQAKGFNSTNNTDI